MFHRDWWVAGAIWITLTGCGSSHPDSDPLRPLQLKAESQLAAGDVRGARQLFEQGLTQARSASSHRDISRFASGLGLCELASHHYGRALSHFQDALAHARQDESDKRADRCASASNNIARVYDRMGDRDNAIRATLAGLDYRPGADLDARLRLNLAINYASAGRWDESEKSFQELIARARQSQQPQVLARSLENLGYQLTSQGRLAEAETALAECLRVRQTQADPELPDTYFVRARLRFAQHRHTEALADLDRYAASGRTHYWIGRVHHLRGRILRELGNSGAALTSFREAVQAARRRRIHIVPTENFLLSSEVTLADVYADFVHAASDDHARSGREESLAEALAASEEIRVASYRAAFFTPDRWADRYSGYLEVLQKLDAAESARVRPGVAEFDRLRLALVENEAKMALEEPLLVLPQPDPRTHLANLRRSVGADEAVFVFHVSVPGSRGWLITREGVESGRLPPSAELAVLTRGFAKALKNNALEARATGLELFTKIFGEFSGAAATKLHWSLVLDGPLFEVPYAVLPVPTSAQDQKLGRQPTLVDRHAISLLPSFFPGGKPRAGNVNKLFAGIGDPIYNAADPRFAGARPVPSAELSRLPGTAVELERAADIWKRHGYQAELLMGVDASTGRLFQVAGSRPAILHLAAHFVDGPRIAFSLLNGKSDGLGLSDFSRFRVPGSLVLMAGCSSGRGDVLPGVGLVGLTRSWLLSGAQGVVGNLWPVPDDTGDFPVEFYLRLTQLKKNNDNEPYSGSNRLAWARALRQAVLETRAAGRVPASTWSAYYLMGRN